VNGLIYAAVGTVGAFSIVGVLPWIGAMTVGNLASFLAFSNQYTKPFNEISGVVAELQNAVSCAQRVFEVLDTPSEPDDSHCEVLKTCQGRLEFKDVSFSYLPEKPLIQHFSMKSEHGQKIAIVGKTGCGKSTLVRILLGFEKPDKGGVYYDGRDIEKLDKGTLRRRMGTVMKSSGLFQGTIFSNIAVSSPDITSEQAWAAAETAGIADDIRAMPMGMRTIISEGSGGISGGQRQRILIARAIVSDPKILIFDEATSALDIMAKREVQDALLNIFYSSEVDPTIINVTHDISEAVYLSNRVYILKPNPCTIYSVIDIDFGDVRRTPDIRNLEKFSNYVKQIENIMEEINNNKK
jgi:ATP-binding cassette subfamily B protein